MEATRAWPCWAKCLACIAAGLNLVAGYDILMLTVFPADTLYSVAINSASGLDPAASPTDLSLGHPEFNVTLTIASDTFRRRACMGAGTYVEVLYRCVPLASSAATPHRICAAAGTSRHEIIVARGIHMRLPGYMMDSLAADIRSGVEAFGVMLRSSRGNVNLASCDVTRVGDDTASCGGGNDMCP